MVVVIESDLVENMFMVITDEMGTLPMITLYELSFLEQGNGPLVHCPHCANAVAEDMLNLEIDSLVATMEKELIIQRNKKERYLLN